MKALMSGVEIEVHPTGVDEDGQEYIGMGYQLGSAVVKGEETLGRLHWLSSMWHFIPLEESDE